MSIEVYYCNGTFLVHDTNQALSLRKRHRIVSQPVHPQAPATGPHFLDPHAANVIWSNDLAVFKRLSTRRDTCSEENKRLYEARMRQLIDRERELFTARRLDELKRHDVKPSEQTMKEFDVTKMRISVDCTPDPNLSVFESVTLTRNEVRQLLDMTIDNVNLNTIYHDLYTRGFYLSSGMKFGCDLLAYMGDPVRYHAEYAVRLVPGSPSGHVDLDKISFSEINSFQRLTHTANKTPVFATVTESETDGSPMVRYWTIGERIYLDPGSKGDELNSIDLAVSCSNPGPSSSRSPMDNKTRRTC